MPRDFFDPTPEQQFVVLINTASLHEAERLIESCEHCNPDGAEIPFDNILDRVTGSDPSVTDYVLEEPAKCPNCRRDSRKDLDGTGGDGFALHMKGTIKYLALMGLVLTSCNHHPSGPQITELKRPTQQLKLVPAAQANGSAAIACGDFRKTMNEVSKRLITDGELRQRIGSVYDKTRLGTLDSGSAKPPDDFGPSATEMLRAIIQGH